MHNLSIQVIKHFVENHALWAYIIIVLGIIIEGEVVVIFAGIFSHLGSLDLRLSFLCVILGGISKSFLGYIIGFYLNKYHAHNNFLRKIERRISYFSPHFCQRPFWSIFISRFLILGMSWFTIIYSGFKKISIKIFAKAEILSLIIWSTGVLALGYFFSYTALSISRDVRKFIGIILLFFIAFFLLEKLMALIFEFLGDGENNGKNNGIIE